MRKPENKINSPEIEGLAERIKIVREELGLTQAEMKAKTGAGQTRISEWEGGNGNPSLTYLRVLSDTFKYNLNWLFLGRGPKKLEASEALETTPEAPAAHKQDLVLVPAPPLLRAVPDGELESDYHQIPFREDMRLAAGEGEAPENFYEVEASPVVIHKSTLRRHRTASLAAFKVGGDSMEPTIMKDGVIVVDLADKGWDKFKDMGIYMLRLDGVPAVKRLKWAKKNVFLVVISDNPDEDTKYREVEEVELFGRVIWIWGEH